MGRWSWLAPALASCGLTDGERGERGERGAHGECASGRPPNVILILADDLGWADVGVHGARDFATRNLDRLAREGVRSTDFHAAQAVCSAWCEALLTGCYPNRIGIEGALGPDDRHGLAESETTLAELARGARESLGDSLTGFEGCDRRAPGRER